MWSAGPRESDRCSQGGFGDLARKIEQAERGATVLAQSMMGSAPFIQKPSGRGERHVVLASLWCVMYGVLRGQGALDWDARRLRFWNTALRKRLSGAGCLLPGCAVTRLRGRWAERWLVLDGY